MEALTRSDVTTMSAEEIRETNRDLDIDEDEVLDIFPGYEHHMTVKAKLRALAQKGVIDPSDVESIHAQWMDER